MTKIVKNILEYTVIFETAEEGGYVARVPALNNCASQGETFEEAVQNIREAISGVVAVMEDEGLEVPQEKSDTIFSKITVPYPFAIA